MGGARQAKTLGLPVMVAFPASYDAMWVQWYLHRFVGDDPFRRRAIDIKAMAMVAMGAGCRATTKSSLPKHWRPPARHTHVAVEDAIEQGELFMNIVRKLNAQRGEIAPPRESEDATETLSDPEIDATTPTKNQRAGRRWPEIAATNEPKIDAT